MNPTPFEMAMEALEARDADYVRAQRMHAANLMAFGATPADIDPSLAEIDHLEITMREAREALRGYEEAAR